jgi:hypothetical protein
MSVETWKSTCQRSDRGPLHWAADKPVSAVCHGPTVFLEVMDTKTGEPLVKGKKNF